MEVLLSCGLEVDGLQIHFANEVADLSQGSYLGSKDHYLNYCHTCAQVVSGEGTRGVADLNI
jgi:hypothetical protein